MPKVSIIGAGHVGSQATACCAARGLQQLVLLDIQPGLANGHALDIMQAQAVRGAGPLWIEGTDDYAATADSDIVVITAGQARKTGMSRSDLLNANAAIVTETVQQALRWSPHCILVIVTNPINTMVHLAQQISGFERKRILGMAGILDNARLRWALSLELKVTTAEVNCRVIGDHGDYMVAVLSQARCGDRPLADCLSSEQIARAVQRARQGGTEIVEALRTGSAAFAPGEAIADFIAALTANTPRILCCSCLLQGEYGVHNVFVGVTAEIDRGGLVGIEQLMLSPEEGQQLHTAVKHIQERNQRLMQYI